MLIDYMNFSKTISPQVRDKPMTGYQFTQTYAPVFNDVDNIYINTVLDHDEPTYNFGTLLPVGPTVYLTDDEPETAQYNSTKNDIIVGKGSDYFLSVIRFTIPLNLTPITIMAVVPNQPALGLADPNLTPYIIGIKLAGVTYAVNLLYVSNQLNFPAPVQNQPLQVITPYYYVYSYTQIMNMINTALATAYTNSGLAAALPGFVAPHFILDPATNLITLVVSAHFTAVTAPLVAQPIIFMNNALSATYLDNFNLRFLGFNKTNGDEYEFILNPTYPENFYYPSGVTVPATTVPPAVPATPLYFRFIQDYSCLQYWSTLRRVVLTSSMPINKEYLPAVVNQNNFVSVNTSGVNLSYPILHDVIPNISTEAGVSREIIYYVPTTQYRLVDVMSDAPIQNINIRIFWEDTNSNFYPLMISTFQQCSVKLGFFKKDLYKGGSNLIK